MQKSAAGRHVETDWPVLKGNSARQQINRVVALELAPRDFPPLVQSQAFRMKPNLSLQDAIAGPSGR